MWADSQRPAASLHQDGEEGPAPYAAGQAEERAIRLECRACAVKNIVIMSSDRQKQSYVNIIISISIFLTSLDLLILLPALKKGEIW